MRLPYVSQSPLLDGGILILQGDIQMRNDQNERIYCKLIQHLINCSVLVLCILIRISYSDSNMSWGSKVEITLNTG
jgi:hypothetical protein